MNGQNPMTYVSSIPSLSVIPSLSPKTPSSTSTYDIDWWNSPSGENNNKQNMIAPSPFISLATEPMNIAPNPPGCNQNAHSNEKPLQPNYSSAKDDVNVDVGNKAEKNNNNKTNREKKLKKNLYYRRYRANKAQKDQSLYEDNILLRSENKILVVKLQDATQQKEDKIEKLLMLVGSLHTKVDTFIRNGNCNRTQNMNIRPW